MTAAGSKDAASIGGGHPLTEAMLVDALAS